MVAFGTAVLLLAANVVFLLGSVVRDGQDNNTEIVQRSWVQKCWSCRASLCKMIPATAIKISVTVWQIISQVCRY